ncbi:hypothetical protein AMAG_09161 [Allomyces macrogynus ATCC 38327]|uniref:Uncharacterized protein n=1 Tax=Allomyces macrogynus (strain ATCC 38327) TaxID=578462 RepID=A0A0L0SNY7_ALLM3|nr:hypothetical protein AMAG_09161 [Allomyces macrogynus ATCC 38327]|eukprot:KNE64099.1 hypothetical protein AMAG_09161 [Allomyces macrogynus ATCC 38327]
MADFPSRSAAGWADPKSTAASTVSDRTLALDAAFAWQLADQLDLQENGALHDPGASRPGAISTASTASAARLELLHHCDLPASSPTSPTSTRAPLTPPPPYTETCPESHTPVAGSPRDVTEPALARRESIACALPDESTAVVEVLAMLCPTIDRDLLASVADATDQDVAAAVKYLRAYPETFPVDQVVARDLGLGAYWSTDGEEEEEEKASARVAVRKPSAQVAGESAMLNILCRDFPLVPVDVVRSVVEEVAVAEGMPAAYAYLNGLIESGAFEGSAVQCP